MPLPLPVVRSFVRLFSLVVLRSLFSCYFFFVFFFCSFFRFSRIVLVCACVRCVYNFPNAVCRACYEFADKYACILWFSPFFLFGQKQDHSHLSHPPFIWKLLTRAREHEHFESMVWELRGRVESVVCCVYISSAYGMLGDFPSSVVRTMSEWTDLFMPFKRVAIFQYCASPSDYVLRFSVYFKSWLGITTWVLNPFSNTVWNLTVNLVKI